MLEQQQSLFIIGLGNPGKKYAQTRHNLGFLVVERFATHINLPLKPERRFFAKCAKGVRGKKEVHLLLPQTFMNESGWAIKRYLDDYKLAVQQILIVCDDVALPFGQLRLRERGSAGGHNGLKSGILHLGTEDFARLRMGIGKPAEGQSLSEYVLAEFNAEEKPALDTFITCGTAELIAKLTL